MPLYRYWSRDSGLGASKLTASTALASLMASTGYAVRALSVTSGEYTTASGSTEQPFTATSSSGDVSISGVMPPGAQLIYTDDPQRQAVILLAGGGTVEITGRTPAMTQDEYARYIHGSMLNPPRATGPANIPLQGYDQRVPQANTTINTRFSISRAATFPLTMAENDTLVCCLSNVPVAIVNTGGLPKEYFSLTVLSGAVPAGEIFAPAVARTSPEGLIGVDVDAIYASLPRYASAGTSPYPVEDYVERAELFQASVATLLYPATSYPAIGYPYLMPFGTGVLNANYGREIAGMHSGLWPVLWTDVADEALTKRAIRAVLSWGRQADMIPVGPNGGHFTYSFPMQYLYRYWTGQDISRYVMGAKGVAPAAGGNQLNQFFYETPEHLALYRTPHNTLGNPDTSAIRSVTAVSGQSITLTNDSPNATGKYAFRGLILRNTAGTKQAVINGPGPGNTSGTTFTITVSGANPFVVGDSVWMDDERAVVAGDPNWAVKWSSLAANDRAADNLSKDASGGYRNLATGGDFVLLAQALGIIQPTWGPMVDYCVKTVPPVGSSFGVMAVRRQPVLTHLLFEQRHQ